MKYSVAYKRPIKKETPPMIEQSVYLGKRIYDPEYGFGVIWAEEEDEVIIHLDRPTGEYTKLLVSKSALIMCRPTLHNAVDWKVQIDGDRVESDHAVPRGI